jgi:predicted TIM-barrel fold metal-dependent hydrolase
MPLKIKWEGSPVSGVGAIIDGHTHIFPKEVREHRENFLRRAAAFRLLYEDPRTRVATAEELVADMNTQSVDQAVICGFPWEDMDLCRWHNDYLLDSAQRYPGRLIPFACVPAKTCGPAAQEIHRSIQRGMRGVGEIAGYAGQDLLWAKPLAEVAAEVGVPLLIHTSEEIGHHYPGKVLHGLRSLFQFICAFPQLTIILAHWGGGLFFYELMPEVAMATRRVLYDTAASPYLYDSRIYEIAVKIVGPDRIIFGSDYPLIQPARYIRDIESAGLELSTRKKILGENLAATVRTAAI